MFKLRVFAASLFFLLTSVGHAGTAYVWRDADGVKHYSDVCPPGENCKEMTLRDSGSGWTKNAKKESLTTNTTTSTTTDTNGTSTSSGGTDLSGGTTTTSGGTTTTSGGTETSSSGTTTSSGDTTTNSSGTTTSSTGTTTSSTDTTTSSTGTTTSSTDTTSTSGGTTTSTSGSGQATLYWDPVGGAASYRIYYGTNSSTLSPPYGSGLNVGNVTSYTVTGLDSGKRYYFNATAVDPMGNESIISDQVFKDIP